MLPKLKYYISAIIITSLLVIVPLFFQSKLAFATAGINPTINFQGKVVKSDGTNVTDGNYDFVFRIYQVATDGSADWTETWNSGTSQVSVQNGIFTVALGTYQSLSAFDFNQDMLYLSMQFFNESSEMTPRIRMAAVPYAFNAEKVAGLTVTNTTGTLTLTNAKTLTVSDSTTLATNAITFGGGEVLTLSATNALSLLTTGATSVTLPTLGTLLTNSAAAVQTITSTQSLGTVLGVTDSTALTGVIKGFVITLSGVNAFDQTGLEFNLSNATGTNLNDIVGTAGSWKVSKAGVLTVASCTGCESGSQTPWTQNIDADNFSLLDFGPNLTSRAGLTITSTSSNIGLQAAGTGTTANIQIGAGGAGSTTPDLLVLDVKSDAEGALAGTNGAMYYNASTNKFRCYQNSAWTDCIGTGGSGVPKESHVIFFTESNETNAIAF